MPPKTHKINAIAPVDGPIPHFTDIEAIAEPASGISKCWLFFFIIIGTLMIIALLTAAVVYAVTPFPKEWENQPEIYIG